MTAALHADLVKRLIDELRLARGACFYADGDRDWDTGSRLKVEIVLGIGRLCEEAADAIKSLERRLAEVDAVIATVSWDAVPMKAARTPDGLLAPDEETAARLAAIARHRERMKEGE